MGKLCEWWELVFYEKSWGPLGVELGDDGVVVVHGECAGANDHDGVVDALE